MKTNRIKIIFLVIIAVICMTAIVGCNRASDKIMYKLTYTASEGGHLSGVAEQEVAEGSDGEAVTAIADEGYKFVKWSDGLKEAERQDKNVTSDKSVTAEFIHIEYCMLKYNATVGGRIEGNTQQKVEKEQDGTAIVAVADENYQFVKWSDGLNEAERQDKNVTADKVVTAEFAPIEHYYTLNYIAGEGGCINGETNQTVLEHENGTSVTAVAEDRYKFLKWSDGKTNPMRQETNVTADLNLTAIFIQNIFNVIYLSDENGYIEGEASQTVEYGKSSSSVTAIPNEGYSFVCWSDGMASATRTERNVKSDITLTAKFAKINFTVRYRASLYGSIEGETTQSVAYGENSTLVTAVPNVGCKFIKWSDGYTDLTRQEKNVKSNLFISAIFEKLTFTATYTFEGNGILDGELNQVIEYGEASSTVTAIPDEGFRFVKWSDTGSTNPIRKDYNVKKDINAVAIFDVLVLKVTYYISSGYFVVDGEKYHGMYRQYVNYGCDTPLKLKPILYNNGESDFTNRYVFIKWSDGLETAERQDFKVTEDITVNAIFGIKLTYRVEGEGGKITGNCSQVVEEGSDAEKITAIPDEGYVFDGWSDWSELMLNSERQDRNVVNSGNYVAYFALIEKTFKYHYGEIFGAPLQDKVVINRYNLKNVQFSLPELQGYEFCGWYTDKTYTTKFANENGKLMLGYYTFNLETDTIYAKWKNKTDEEILTYKILTLGVEEIHVPELELYMDENIPTVDMHFTSTAILRKLYALHSLKVAEYLNKWFEGKINFEVDTYYTTEVLNVNNLSRLPSELDRYYYRLKHETLTEISDLISNERYYRNVIAIYDFGPKYSRYMRFGAAGNGTMKYAHVFVEGMANYPADEINIHVQRLERELNNDKSSLWEREVSVYLHEFCHTIQFKFNYDYDFHKVFAETQFLEAKYYLLCQAVVDDKKFGIPYSYWTEGGDYMF